MKLWKSPTKSVWTAAFLSAVVAILAFMNSLANDFAYDDRLIILANTNIQSWESLPGTFLAPYWPNEFGRELGLWRPLTTWVYGLEWMLFGGAPVGFHIVNVLLNGLATGLVVVFLAHLMPLGAAFVAGLVFAVHPVHVEAVSNVVGMAEVLATVFYLGACIVIVRKPGRMPTGWTLFTCVAFGLACLTKESAITLPGAVLLLDSCRRELKAGNWVQYLQARWPLYGGLVLTAAAVLWGRMVVLGSVANPFAPMGADILAEDGVSRIWTVLATWPEIVRLLFFPADLSADYTPEVISIAWGWNAQNVLGLALGLGALFAAWASWRQGRLSTRTLSPRLLGFGVLWFVITLSPTSNVVFLSGVLLAERTLYLPSVGFVAALGWLLASLYRERPRVAGALVTVCLCLLTFKTVIRTPAWKDNTTVFETMLAEHPESGRSQWFAGDQHFNRGEMQLGLAAYRRAIGMVGGHYSLVSAIGRNLVAKDYDRVGEYLLRHAWRERPELGLAPALLAAQYDGQGRWEESEAAVRAVLAIDSTSALNQHILARTLTAQGRVEEAIEARYAAIRLGEDRWQQWKWLSDLELERGDTTAALQHLDAALTRVGGPEALEAVQLARQAILGPGESGGTGETQEGLQNPGLPSVGGTGSGSE
ncbi:MAG: hypothetical protein ACR2QM_13345 [Longimicrobiales bacterium]